MSSIYPCGPGPYLIPTNRERRRKRWPWLVAVLYVVVCWAVPAITDNYWLTWRVLHGFALLISLLAWLLGKAVQQ